MRASVVIRVLVLLLLLIASEVCAGQTGVASWYGAPFHGRRTASGETYNMHAMTAAHKTLPLGTRLEVTRLDNGRVVNVVVNDRGPFVRGRILDLSFAAGKKLRMIEDGTIRVRLRVTGRDTRYVRYLEPDATATGTASGTGRYVVQLGAFTDRENAERLKSALNWSRSGAYISKVGVTGKVYFRVRLGSFKARDKAARLAVALAQEGYPAVIMRE